MQQSDEFFNDDIISNNLEQFTEYEQVLQMINDLNSCEDENFEKQYESFAEVLTRYQEQPHLLDPHLENILQCLLTKIRNPGLSDNQIHAAFTYLYIVCKVRTYKVLVKFLPHELSDLEFALDLLERQNPKQHDHWETRYMLLLWMSILVLNPFHMSRLDAYQTTEDTGVGLINHVQAKPKMERIYDQCKLYSASNDTCSGIAAFLSSKFFVRSDIKELYLEKFIDWIISENKIDSSNTENGQLAAVAAILKNGKREDLMPYADKLLQWIISCDYKNSSDYLKYKYSTKIIQRIGLLYLKPRVAVWRYKRGTRSLATNLNQTVASPYVNEPSEVSNTENEEEIIVPDMIEEVIEELLQGLRSGGSNIRWSAAKGIGRIANRLSRELGDQIIGSILEILSPLEPHEAWHGSCLALAELAKRGLLLPHRLNEIVPLLSEALFYDEMKGYMSVGQHIRDSACYMCWAFARAYHPEDLQPFVHNISTGLLTVAVFDREINCRRAASAAFQESVGRLGNFPHGIEISTTTDFYTVGLRTNSYLKVSSLIAQYEEYRIPLIDHVVTRKVTHWDGTIRELSAKALHKLTYQASEYMANVILAKLFLKTKSIDINIRHGSILAIGEITSALRNMENASENSDLNLISNQSLSDINELIPYFIDKDMFKGVSGEIMKQCCTAYIRNCSLGKINVTPKALESWQLIIDRTIINKADPIRWSAISAFSELCEAYYHTPESTSLYSEIIKEYLRGAEGEMEEQIRMGYVSALGVLPYFMIEPEFDQILNALIKYSLIPTKKAVGDNVMIGSKMINSENWSESRRDSVKALVKFVKTVGFSNDRKFSFGNRKYFNIVMKCLLKAVNEYTIDNRGDIGAWVREASMNAFYELLTICRKEIIGKEMVLDILLNFVQQSVEKIDRTRGLAGRLFCNLIHSDPPIPHIPEHEKLKEIFPKDSSTVLWLFADHTFPLFCSLLELPHYSKHVLLGLSASVGQLTESLIKHSSDALFNFLFLHPNDIPRICNEIISNFNENLLNERVTYPMLSFLDIILNSAILDTVFLDKNSNFADEIFRLTSLEIKGQKKLYKLVGAINVYCHLIQIPHLCKKILSKLTIFLGSTHVHVRKTTQTKLYETLTLYGDNCGFPEHNLEEILSILSDTDFTLPIEEVRPIRNKLCTLMGIKEPTVNVKAN